MRIQLPEVIDAFFLASNDVDVVALGRCFTEDAVVSDEHHTYQGRQAIQDWLRETQRKYAYRTEPMGSTVRGAQVEVRAKVSGNFPGSPVELTHTFQMRGDSIESLDIG